MENKFKKVLAAVATLTICGICANSNASTVLPLDKDISTWRLGATPPTHTLLLECKDRNKLVTELSDREIPKAFGVLEPSQYKEICDSEEKCKALFGNSVQYLSAPEGSIVDNNGSPKGVIKGGNWVQLDGKNITFELLIQAAYCILSDGLPNGQKILLTARDKQTPFFILKGRLILKPEISF